MLYRHQRLSSQDRTNHVDTRRQIFGHRASRSIAWRALTSLREAGKPRPTNTAESWSHSHDAAARCEESLSGPGREVCAAVRLLLAPPRPASPAEARTLNTRPQPSTNPCASQATPCLGG
jgi:hypothetical protein